MRRRDPKPTQDSFIEFYIVWPIQNLFESINEGIRKTYRKLTGKWWCEHCEKYHGRRVHKFHWYSPCVLGRTDHLVCSLWKDEQEQIKSTSQSFEPSNSSDKALRL